MGFYTLGRKTTHISETITIKGVELEICAEGVYDFDESYFEADTVYLANTRQKTNSFDLTPRVKKYLLSCDCPHAENWDELARGNF
jgi:hypothetical protein